MSKKVVTLFLNLITITVICYSELSLDSALAESKDNSTVSSYNAPPVSNPVSSSITHSYSYYRGIGVDYIVNPAIRLSYISAVYYNTFLDLGVILSLRDSSKSYISTLLGARYSFNFTEVYSLELGSSLGLRYQHWGRDSSVGLYFIPRLINLFNITSSFILSTDIFTNLNLYRSSRNLPNSIKFNLGLGFIYRL